MKCCICGGEIEKKRNPETGEVYWDQGNDAWPVVEDGRCCDACEMNETLPARLKLREKKNAKA